MYLPCFSGEPWLMHASSRGKMTRVWTRVEAEGDMRNCSLVWQDGIFPSFAEHFLSHATDSPHPPGPTSPDNQVPTGEALFH